MLLTFKLHALKYFHIKELLSIQKETWKNLLRNLAKKLTVQHQFYRIVRRKHKKRVDFLCDYVIDIGRILRISRIAITIWSKRCICKYDMGLWIPNKHRQITTKASWLSKIIKNFQSQEKYVFSSCYLPWNGHWNLEGWV
jgi:hypothetical protein